MKEGGRGRHRRGTGISIAGQGQVGEGRPDRLGSDQSRKGRN